MDRRTFVAAATLPVALASGAHALGPITIDQGTPEFWDSAVVLLGEVESIQAGPRAWSVMYFRTHAAVSGAFDCTARSVLSVSFLCGGLGLPTPKAGRPLMIVLSILSSKDMAWRRREEYPDVEAHVPYAWIQSSPARDRGPIIPIENYDDPQIAKFAESIRAMRTKPFISWIER